MPSEALKQSFPKIDAYSYMSSVDGIYVIGEACGTTLLKNSINSGYEVMAGLDKAITYEGHVGDPDAYDVTIIGSGASGFSAAIEAANRGIKYIILESGEFGNKLLSLPKAWPIYAEPEDVDVRGELWFKECTKEELYDNWCFQAEEYQLNIKTGVKVVDIRKYGDYFRCIAEDGNYYSSKRVVIATGKDGLPKKLGISGENLSKVYTSLINPDEIVNKEVCIAGGGDDACKTALKLLENNSVTMVVKESEISGDLSYNKREINKNHKLRKLNILFNKEVININELEVTIDGVNENSPFNIKNDIFFSMTGTEDPAHLFKRSGLKLKSEIDVFRIVLVFFSLVLSYALFSFVLGYFPFSDINKKITDYKTGLKAKVWTKGISSYATGGELIKVLLKSEQRQGADVSDDTPSRAVILTNENFSPQENIRFQLIKYSGFDKSSTFEENVQKVKFNATVLSSYMQNDGRFKITVVFSETNEFVDALYKYWDVSGRKRAYPFNDPVFYLSIFLTFLIIIFGIAPFNKYASFKGGGVKKSYQRKRYLILIGFQLVMFLIVPYFIAKSPAVFKLIYPWPLMYNSFINKSIIITVGALLLFTLVLPLFVLYHGKRFCSFVCTIGAVSQTCGNNLRHLAPKGKTAKKFEVISYGVLLFTAAATFIILFSGKGSAVSQITQSTYRFTVIFLLAAIVSVSLIPLFGAKVFCRFFCPLSRVMELLSKLFVKAKKSKFKIEVFDRCIKCGECSKHCEVAIDVMSYSKDALSFTDKEVSCTGCGVCISVCPVDNLAFPSMAGHLKGKKTLR